MYGICQLLQVPKKHLIKYLEIHFTILQIQFWAHSEQDILSYYPKWMEQILILQVLPKQSF